MQPVPPPNTPRPLTQRPGALILVIAAGVVLGVCLLVLLPILLLGGLVASAVLLGIVANLIAALPTLLIAGGIIYLVLRLRRR